MADEGYDAFDDPYSYKGTTVLKNKLGLRDLAVLQSFELEMTTLRASEPLPRGRFGPAHYREIHRHLFQDVYSWAGKYRIVRTAKGGNMFCYPEHIAASMEKLFGVFDTAEAGRADEAEAFIQNTVAFLAELNAIHPFREGNGRSQLTWLSLIGERAGFPFHFASIQRATFLPAMIESFAGNLGPLTGELTGLLA